MPVWRLGHGYVLTVVKPRNGLADVPFGCPCNIGAVTRISQFTPRCAVGQALKEFSLGVGKRRRGGSGFGRALSIAERCYHRSRPDQVLECRPQTAIRPPLSGRQYADLRTVTGRISTNRHCIAEAPRDDGLTGGRKRGRQCCVVW